MARRKKAFRWWVAIGMLVVLLAGTVGVAFIKPLPAPVLAEQALPTVKTAAPSLAWPGYGQSAIGSTNDGVIATSGAQAPLATASVAKVMTALAVLRVKPLAPGQSGPIITITAADINSYNSYVSQGGSVVPVNSGEQLSEYQALQAMLLPSANNIADTLARWAFGSVDAYLTYANTYAKQLGLTSFHAADASGFEAGTVSSAQDLTKLGMAALQKPILATIVNQPTATIPVAGTIENVNFLLGSHGVVGIKTGNNDADPGAFLFAATQPVAGKPVTVVGTIMGGSTLRGVLRDSTALIDSAFTNMTSVPVITADATAGSYRAVWSSNSVAIHPAKNVSLTLWNGQALTIKAHFDPTPKLPVASGTSVGSLDVLSATGKQLTTVPLQVTDSIETPTMWWRLAHLF